MTIKRIGNSKYPLPHQIPTMIENLKTLDKWIYISIEIHYSDYNSDEPVEQSFNFCFQPGLNHHKCSIHKFKTWEEALFAYRCFMDGILPLTNEEKVQ